MSTVAWAEPSQSQEYDTKRIVYNFKIPKYFCLLHNTSLKIAALRLNKKETLQQNMSEAKSYKERTRITPWLPKIVKSDK